MYPAYIPKQLKSRKADHSCNDSKWRNMTSPYSKKISALLRVKTSKHDGDFYYLNYLYSFRRKNKLELYKKYVKITIFVVLQFLPKTLRFWSLINTGNLIRHYLFMQILKL